MAKSSPAPSAQQQQQQQQQQQRPSSSEEPAGGSGTAGRGNRPVETLRYRNLKAAIWKNQGQSGPFYGVTFTRSYRDDQEQWHDVTNFNSGDLPMLAKLANDCHSFITREERKAADSEGGRR